VLARAAAFAAIALAFVVGRRLSGAVGGVLAAVGVGFCGLYPTYAAAGDVTGLFLALVLGGLLAWWDGRRGVVLACATVCALLRVEAWPFALALGVVLWRSDRRLRPWLAGAGVLVPLAWFVPELVGSGDLLRSGGRARIPNPGQPAEASFPFGASLVDALALPLVPLLLAALLSHRVRWLAAAGAAWVLLVAVMAEAGFSGEARYALPGAALLAVAGAVALGGLPGRLALAAAAVVLAFAVPRIVDLDDLHERQAHQQRLSAGLSDAIAVAGGRDTVLRCGTAYVGPLRGPLLAYRLDIAKEDVEPDARPAPPGTVFRSQRLQALPAEPEPAGLAPVGRSGPWEVRQRCQPADSAR
jgi:hypothetical protein